MHFPCTQSVTPLPVAAAASAASPSRPAIPGGSAAAAAVDDDSDDAAATTPSVCSAGGVGAVGTTWSEVTCRGEDGPDIAAGIIRCPPPEAVVSGSLGNFVRVLLAVGLRVRSTDYNRVIDMISYDTKHMHAARLKAAPLGGAAI